MPSAARAQRTLAACRALHGRCGCGLFCMHLSTAAVCHWCAQVKRAQECEANTGPAQKPQTAASSAAGGAQAADGAAGDDDEVRFCAVLSMHQRVFCS